MIEDFEFALCLTHDVDRVYKTFQAPYYAFKERDLSHLRSLVSSERPYWNFEVIMKLEEELGVRSSFYFLNEKNLFRDKSPHKWANPKNWKLYTGRYDITDDKFVDVIQKLDQGGWEVGLHGSYDSYRNPDRLRLEKERLESILGSDIIGGRQHYLNLIQPKTWEYHRDIGLQYDASLGSSTEFGFDNGYKLQFPFNDDFAVFPLTIMDNALMEKCPNIDIAHDECKRLLREAKTESALMTVLWHPKTFNNTDYPGYRETYERLIKEAKTMNAWIGSPGAFYREVVDS